MLLSVIGFAFWIINKIINFNLTIFCIYFLMVSGSQQSDITIYVTLPLSPQLPPTPGQSGTPSCQWTGKN